MGRKRPFNLKNWHSMEKMPKDGKRIILLSEKSISSTVTPSEDFDKYAELGVAGWKYFDEVTDADWERINRFSRLRREQNNAGGTGMITKETARQIFNCYQQLEEIEKLEEEMTEEVKRVRERENDRKADEPIPENSFGRFGKGMQLGVPNGCGSSMRIFNISPETAVMVMDEQRRALKKKLNELEGVARLEMNKNND